MENDKDKKFIDIFKYNDMPKKLKDRVKNKPPKKDKRRDYCYSKPDPLFDSIVNDLKCKKVKFLPNEKKELLNCWIRMNLGCL